MDETLILLSRVSVGVQVSAVALIALFFSFLARTFRLEEVRLWSLAWFLDTLALGAVFANAFFPMPAPWPRVMLTFYAAGKTAFVFLLVSGTRHHLTPGIELSMEPWKVGAVIGLFSMALGAFAPDLTMVQLAQCFMVGMVLLTGGIWVFRHPRAVGSRWLGLALLLEGTLFLGYVPALALLMVGTIESPSLLSSSGFLDAAAELFVALASLVALGDRAMEQMKTINADLLAAQERLRLMVDTDPLTALSNRRKLRGELRRVQPLGATFLFVDLDDFKEINDRHGHAAGDLCLKRVASVLQVSFRPDDAIIRYGGDEFLVIAVGFDRELAEKRVAAIRKSLAEPPEAALPCSVSVGISVLLPGGDPEVAVRQADERMYAEKRARPAPVRGIS
ncbi:MAG: GGDEF domain-containing protein [Acidobacteriota bacterium]